MFIMDRWDLLWLFGSILLAYVAIIIIWAVFVCIAMLAKKHVWLWVTGINSIAVIIVILIDFNTKMRVR